MEKEPGRYTFFRLLQHANASAPIKYTLFGITMLSREEQPENAYTPICERPNGREMFFSEVQSRNTSSDITLVPQLSVTVSNCEHWSKTPYDSVLTLPGTLTLLRESHNQKASFPILVTLSAMVTVSAFL